MRPRDIVSANILQLMAASPTLDTLPKVTAAGGGSNGALDRWRRAVVPITVDDLGRLAAVFGLEPWEMLLESHQREAVHAMLRAAQSMTSAPAPKAMPERPQRKRAGARR